MTPTPEIEAGAPQSAAAGRALSVLLRQLAADDSRERIAVGDLVSALGDRAVGALLFVFAFPNMLPVPPGTSSVLGVPLLLLAAQLSFGRAPWLPGIVSRRSMPRSDFATLVRRIAPWLERAERLLQPRWSVLARPPMENLVGLVCLWLAVILVLPIPLGNVFPAVSIGLMALGILERDGLWVLAGLAGAVASTSVVYGVMFAMVKAGLYLFTGLMA